MARSGTWAFGVGPRAEGGFVALLTDEDAVAVVSLVEHAEPPTAAQLAEQLRAAFVERGRPRKIVVLDGATAKALRGAAVRETIVVGRSRRLSEALGAVAGGVPDERAVSEFEAAMARWIATRPLEREPRFLVEARGLGIENGIARVVEVDGQPGWMLHFSPADAKIVLESHRAGRAEGFDADTMAVFGEPLGDDASEEDRAASVAAGLVSAELGSLRATLVRNRREGAKVARTEDYDLATAITRAMTEVAGGEVRRVTIRIEAGEVIVSGPYADRAG